MLSAVLKSDRAVQMSILIVRAFVRLRELLATNKEFARRIEHLETSQIQQGRTQQEHTNHPRYRLYRPQPQEKLTGRNLRHLSLMLRDEDEFESSIDCPVPTKLRARRHRAW